MNWFLNRIKKKAASQLKVDSKYTKAYFEGLEAFKIGKKLYNDSILVKPMSGDRRRQKEIAALEFFDQAIEKGYDDADVYSCRGSVLNDLGYLFDALEDYNKAIENDPQKANPYFMRALIRQNVYDYEGGILDLEEAVRLSKFETADNDYWNDYSEKTGFGSATLKYETDLEWAKRSFEIYTDRVAMDKEHWKKEYSDRRAIIKRRAV
jgi:tetratricopeptide (TPR) repeat protein